MTIKDMSNIKEDRQLKRKKRIRKWILIGVAVVLVLAIAAVSIFLQLYKYHYNKGNEYYDSYKYSDAAAEYNKALSYPVPDGEECAIKVNLVLAKIAPVNFDNVPEADLSDTIDLLSDCIDLLCEDGCAHKNDENGHDSTAQELKDELEQILEKLKEQQEQGQSGSDSDEDQDNTGGETEEDTRSGEGEATTEQDPSEKQIEDIIRDGTKEHNRSREEDTGEYNYYGGKSW